MVLLMPYVKSEMDVTGSIPAWGSIMKGDSIGDNAPVIGKKS